MEDKKEEKKIKSENKGFVVFMACLFFGLSLLCFARKEDSFSESERRVLQSFPEVSKETILSGEFMKEFETYCLDQFPFRDQFRSLKAMAKLGIFFQKDNNDIYLKKGHLSKMDYPLQTEMMDYAAGRINYIYERYLKENNSWCYFSIIPDKNMFLAKENGYLAYDYEELFSYMQSKLEFAGYIDITGLLGLEDYYKTDTHWRQENITDVAECLKEGMKQEHVGQMSKEEFTKRGEAVLGKYELVKLDTPFYGVYYGQSALPVGADTIYYLNSEALSACKVTSYDTGKAKDSVVYDMEKAKGKDPYEMFLSGASALLVIENPLIETEKELVVFRDSFGSSLIPLLVSDYSKITVIDIRYVQSEMLGQFVDFHGQDTLFLYSTMILNNSLGLR